MIYPHLKEEKKLWSSGYKAVAGLDEAGRGPLAGPVVAGAIVIIKRKAKSETFVPSLGRGKRKTKTQSLKCLAGVKDSKKLTVIQREKFFKILTNHPQIKWGIGKVSEKIIDKINILEATKLAMVKAVKDLGFRADYLILDGNFRIDSPIPQISIIRGDEKVFSCAAASIIAKVYRDRLMQKYHKKYPRYGFSRHKGYPTKAHKAAIKKYGFCPIHRRTFNAA